MPFEYQPRQPSRIERALQTRVSRRSIVQVGAAAVATGTLLNNFSINTGPKVPPPEPTPTAPRKPAIPDTVVLNTILKLPVFSPQRLAAETSYVADAQTRLEIERGLLVCFRKETRRVLLDKSFDLRQQGRQPLDPEYIAWAQGIDINFAGERRIGMHPEMLARALETYPQARRDIADFKLMKMIRPELTFDYATADQVMANPGVVAAILTIETPWEAVAGMFHGLTELGHGVALQEINPEKGIQIADLHVLLNHVRFDTKLEYQPNNVPGSIRGDVDRNISGGALVGYMPSTALEIQDAYKKLNAGIVWNPFNPNHAFRGVWQHLARYGYLRGDEPRIARAFRMWNNDSQHVEILGEVADSYWRKFASPKTS